MRMLSCFLVCLCAGLASAATPPDGPTPPVGGRTLEFDATEGTWMSVDVNPGGDTIVFDLLGDLYTVPVAGGEARLLLGGTAFDAQPVFSPDGSRIAFVSDRSGNDNLWVADADGSNPKQVTKDTGNEAFSSPAWSRDGRSVYVSRRAFRRDEYGLYLYDLAGGTGIRLEEPEKPFGEIMDAVASPDGKSLYYSAKSRAAATLYFTPNWILHRRNLETGATQEVVRAPGGALRPVISPSGREIVYGTRYDGKTGLRVRSLATGEDRWLLYPIDQDSQHVTITRGLLPGFAFLPSGDALVISYGGKLKRVELASGRSQDIPFTAHVNLAIGPSLSRNFPIETGPVRSRLIQGPVQSPDGKKLAFSALAHLYVSDLTDGVPSRLIAGDEPQFEPAWSPDGGTIAYVTWTTEGAGHVWSVNRGGKPKQLTRTPAFYSDPVFSADGKTIYALRSNQLERMQLQEEVTPNRFPDLVRIPAAGGEVEVITHAGLGAQRPFITSDPGRVYYATPEGVVSVRADANDGSGADQRKHIRIEGLHPWSSPGKPIPLDEGVLSPDGRWLLVGMANQLHLVAVPPMAPETPVVSLVADAGRPSRQISKLGADYYAWADGGRTITWAVGSTFFRCAFDPSGQCGAVEQFEQRVEVPRDTPQGKLLLRGATVITMRGDEVIADADLLIENERIAAIGPRGSAGEPAGVEVRDVKGQFIVPGFVDTHAHWYELRHDVLDMQNWSFLMSLAYGVTSGLDVQAMDQDLFAYQDLVDSGRMIGPRAFSVGQGMFSNNRVRSREDVDLLLQRQRDFYRTPNVKSYLIGNRQQRQWVVASALANGLLPTTEGNEELKLDITHAIDGFHGNEHALPAEHLYEDVVRLFVETKIGYTPTLTGSTGSPSPTKNFYLIEHKPHEDPKVRRFMPHFVIDARSSPIQWVRPDQWRTGFGQAESAGRILRAGGRVGIGSHAEFQGPAYHYEMWALAAGGAAPQDVLRAATVNGSEILGRADEIGTIAAGKYADLLVLEKNPLEDIRNTMSIRQVMKNGRLYDGDTLDEVWPRQRPLPPQWFWQLGPMEQTQ